MHLLRTVIDTPLGPMVVLASAESLCALEFISPPSNGPKREPATRSSDERLTRLRSRLDRWFKPYAIEDGSNHVIDRTREWLQKYFSGERADTRPASLELRGTPFELQVWERLQQIPAGATSTYRAIAGELGSAHASRAVGLANGANPIAIIVPCHRVIGSNGSLTGYGGGLSRKQWLLDHERRWKTSPQISLEFDART
jgi:O-6-methylguanine DNA methyltransferase